jgi:hypothetical protein
MAVFCATLSRVCAGYEWDSRTPTAAAAHKQLECLTYAVGEGCSVDDKVGAFFLSRYRLCFAVL